MDELNPRAALTTLVAEHGESLAALSVWLGRNPAYLQQFVRRGSPRRLSESDRRALAGYLGVDEALLGGPTNRSASRAVEIKRFDVAVLAGAGAFGDDGAPASTIIDPAILKALRVRPADLSTVTATGDSMWPTILDGDELLVDHADRRLTAMPTIFVLRLDGVVLVKRLYREGKLATIVSDNPLAPKISDKSLSDVEVIGRVVHLARRMR